jgi:hypothetical protein
LGTFSSEISYENKVVHINVVPEPVPPDLLSCHFSLACVGEADADTLLAVPGAGEGSVKGLNDLEYL